MRELTAYLRVKAEKSPDGSRDQKWFTSHAETLTKAIQRLKEHQSGGQDV